jgi:pimeloyl-ACP methyl ester carboxylesterase
MSLGLRYPARVVRRPRRRCVVVAAIVCLAITGCAAQKGVTLRKTPHNVLAEQLKIWSRGGPEPTPRTVQLLRRYNLLADLSGDPHKLLDTLQQQNARSSSPEMVYSIAELAYLTGLKSELTDPQKALDMYGTAVAHAYLYLFDERVDFGRNPYDPQFRGACDVYNQSLESALRILDKRGQLKPGMSHTCRAGDNAIEVTIAVRSNTWRADDFDKFEFASDYQINGLANQYHTYGLGVPLMVVRQKKPERNGPAEKYYPPGVSFPITAFLRLAPQEQRTSQGGKRSAVLELYDPLVATDVIVQGRRAPLESDLSTPLAYFLNNPAFQDQELATDGLLRPDRAAAARGLYMLEPYQPGKIPVLMVHGLWSSPVTWMQMFNDLRALPEIRERYQFWFYLYPTGQPFWISATQLRQDLAQMRKTFDPEGREIGLDQMVLVGHSMGGLVSKMQTVEGGDRFWQVFSDKPFDHVMAEPEVRQALHSAVYFQPNASVRRVITLGTPHRGSHFANSPTRYLARQLIKLPNMLMQTGEKLRRENPDIFRPGGPADIATSIDSLAPDSPLLPVLYSAPKPPWIKYHNVVGMVEPGGVFRFSAKGDGVVPLDSARLADADSEIVVPADHVSIHTHPLSVLEVRRILLEHLAEVTPPGNPSPPTARSAPPLPLR